MEEKNELLIDERLRIVPTTEEASALKEIQIKFMNSYLVNRQTMPVDQWLTMELKESLPDRDDQEIAQMSEEILQTLKINEEKKASMKEAISRGRSRESWFADEMKKATSHMGTQEAAKYLGNLDEALKNANETMHATILTQNGTVNMNPNLDGFIAEQYHAQTFNLNAEAAGSQYRAKVLQPDGTGYAKNSVDIVIVDKSGKIVRRYQAKYCKDAEATVKAYQDGNYRGQTLLAPNDQSDAINRKHNTVLEAPDGVTSNPLDKASAKERQKKAQSGQLDDLNWKEYRTKDLAIGIGKQAGQAALTGALVGAGMNIAEKVWNGEEIDGSEVVEQALMTGSDFGVKAVTAGALKVGAEKGIIEVIPKGTPASTIANIAHVAVENVKIVGKVATGEMTVRQGLCKMEETTVSTVAGIASSAKASTIGGIIGNVFGPAGAFVGGVVGGAVGYMAGSKVGSAVVKGVQKVREKVGGFLKSGAKAVSSGIRCFTRLLGFA